MTDYPIKSLIDVFFSMFDDFIEFLVPFTSFLTSKISVIVSQSNLPQAAITLINKALELINIGDYSIVSLMLGSGLTLYVVVTFARYIITIFT